MTAIEAETGETPQALLDKPDLDPHLTFVWYAYLALRSDRQIGFGEGPIGFSAIDRYARRYRIIDIDEFEAFAALIAIMDAEELTGVRRHG